MWASAHSCHTPTTELVWRRVTAKPTSSSSVSTRRSKASERLPIGTSTSFCHWSCFCRLANGKSPNAVFDTESSPVSPTTSREVQRAVIWLRLPTCQPSSVVIVRSSKPGPPSYCASMRLFHRLAKTSWPAASARLAFAE